MSNEDKTNVAADNNISATVADTTKADSADSEEGMSSNKTHSRLSKRCIIATALVLCFIIVAACLWFMVGKNVISSSLTAGKNSNQLSEVSNSNDINKQGDDKDKATGNGSGEATSGVASNSDGTSAEGSSSEALDGSSDTSDGNSSGTNGSTTSTTGSTSGTTSDSTTTSPSGQLHVSGTKLVDSNNNIVQLKGVSTHGIQWGEMSPYVNEDTIRSIHDWGANVFRIAMYVEENGYLAGGDQTKLKQIIDDGVTYATKYGMYVIIDWHVLNFSPDRYTTQAQEFFAEMAQKYADHDNIFYEICNEPVGSNWNSNIKPYAEAVISTIRQYDKDAVIIVGTNNWSQDVDDVIGNELSDSNVMYALHFYAATHKDAIRNKLKAALNAGLPIFVSECSICDASGNGSIDYDSANTWLNLLNENSISYVAWSICNKNESSALLSSSCTKLSDWSDSDLSAAGLWFKNAFKGSTTSTSTTSTSSDTSSSSTTSDSTSSNNSQSSSNNSSTASVQDLTVKSNSSGVNATISSGNSWVDSGSDKTTVQYMLTVDNTSSSDVSTWTIKIKVPEGTTIGNYWCCTLELSGTTLTVKPESWNGTITAGGSVSGIGITLSY